MNLEEAKDFCNKWLAAWTGNNPDKLINFIQLNHFIQIQPLKMALKDMTKYCHILKNY